MRNLIVAMLLSSSFLLAQEFDEFDAAEATQEKIMKAILSHDNDDLKEAN